MEWLNKWKKITVPVVVFLLAAIIISGFMYFAGFKTGVLDRWTEDQYAGIIVEVRDNSFVIQGRRGPRKIFEKIIFIGEDTAIREGKEVVGRGELRINVHVIVVGVSLNKDEIEAKVIRIFNKETASPFRNL